MWYNKGKKREKGRAKAMKKITEIQSRLFDYMGGRESYGRLYDEKPEIAEYLESEATRDYAKAEEKSRGQDELFYACLFPGLYPSTKAEVVAGLAYDIEYALTHETSGEQN